MIAGRDPEALVRALADERVPPEPQDSLEARRERMVPAIAKSIRGAGERKHRITRMRKFGIVSMAAAVALALGFSYKTYTSTPSEIARSTGGAAIGVVRTIAGTLVVTHAGRARVVQPLERPSLSAGDELRTASDGGAEVQTERSAIHVAQATQISLLSPSRAEERIRISAGRIDLKVAKQPQARRSVVVETPNADVVVRGTVFSVSVDPVRSAPITRVSVSEGAVWVLHRGERNLVSAGEEWSSDAAASVPAAVGGASLTPLVPSEGEATSLAAPQRPGSNRSGRAARDLAAPSGTLAEENRMFQAAVDARNRGEDRRAFDLFGALLGRYPGGRLAEESRVERMRALRRLGESARAASEARRYLSDFAAGFARDEARSVALGEK